MEEVTSYVLLLTNHYAVFLFAYPPAHLACQGWCNSAAKLISETNGSTDMWCDGVQSPLQRIQSWSSTGNSLWALGSSDLPQCKIPQSPCLLQGTRSLWTPAKMCCHPGRQFTGAMMLMMIMFVLRPGQGAGGDGWLAESVQPGGGLMV